MQKVKLITAVCLALFAGALMAAPEPTVPAPAVDQAIQAGVKTVTEKKSGLELPATAVRNAMSSDELIGWYVDPATQMRYIVYEWDKPAVVNSLTMAANQKVVPGREIMILVPEGRSKGKFKIDIAAKVVKLAPGFKPSAVVEPGTVMAVFQPIEVAHDSVSNTTVVGGSLPSWGEAMKGLWQSTGIYDIINQSSSDFKSTWILGLGRVLMMIVALVLIYLAIVKEFEPLLLLPIGFGALLANIPLAGIAGPDGLQGMVFEVGINSGVFPLLIFMGVGAMTDFGPLIANPKTALLGGAAQFGIFSALIGALLLTLWIPAINFSILDAASIGIIGGADGPTSIYLTSKLSPKLLGAVAVAAYSYMALVPVIQPPVMRLLTTEAERKIRMKSLRKVGKLEKLIFAVFVALFCIMIVPDASALIGMLMFGNFIRESGVCERLSKCAQNELINIVTIFLGSSVGITMTADRFLNKQTLFILALGVVAFVISTAAGVLMAKFMNLFSKDKINPLIGSAGVSAVPMAARVSHVEGQKADPSNFLLMHAMGPNVAGVIGTAVAAGIFISTLSSLVK